MGNWLGLGSAWVSGQVICSGYIANNFPWSNFDLAAFSEKLIRSNSSWKPKPRDVWFDCSRSLCFLYNDLRVDLAIQHFVLSKIFRSRLRLRFLHSLKLLYLFHRALLLQVARWPSLSNRQSKILTVKLENWPCLLPCFSKWVGVVSLCGAISAPYHKKNAHSVCCGFLYFAFAASRLV